MTTSISKGDARDSSTLKSFAARAIFMAQCTAETAYMTADRASIEYLTGVEGRLDLAVGVRVGNRNWNTDIQHKYAREEKDSGIDPYSLAQLCGMMVDQNIVAPKKKVSHR